jgi:hypothetical protein
MRDCEQQKIGIVLPTRGLVFTKVEQAIEELRTCNVKVYRSRDLPIPDGHNQLTKQALTDGCQWIFYIEEDTVPPLGALERLMQADSDISCIDYTVAGWGCITKNAQGKVLWCGLGCTLVKRTVLEAMTYPYFRADMTLRLETDEGGIPVIKNWIQLPKDYIKRKQYGSLDIWFCDQARKLGFTITQVEGECEHLELVELGKRATNNGLHTIQTRPKIEKNQIVEEVI